MKGDKYFDFGSSVTIGAPYVAPPPDTVLGMKLKEMERLLYDALMKGWTFNPLHPPPPAPSGATFVAGNIECPLCFRAVTIETRYNTSLDESEHNGAFSAHVATMREIQFYCAAGCGFLATYIPAMGGHPDKMQLVSCPDEPEPTRMKAMEDWARNSILFVRRRP